MSARTFSQTLAMLALFAAAPFVLASCPKIACNSDDNCPTKQFCVDGLCGATPAAGEGEGSAGEGEGSPGEGEGEGSPGEGEGEGGEGEGEGEGEGGGPLVLVQGGFTTIGSAAASGGFVVVDDGFEKSDTVCVGTLCLTGGFVP